MTIEKAREALEKKVQHYGSQCAAHGLDAVAYRELMEAADAYALAVLDAAAKPADNYYGGLDRNNALRRQIEEGAS